MISHATPAFWREFARLPKSIKKRARRAFDQFEEQPHHPGLQFKRVHLRDTIYSVRIGLGYRALAVRDDEDVRWFWIGSHAEYDELVRRRRLKG